MGPYQWALLPGVYFAPSGQGALTTANRVTLYGANLYDFQVYNVALNASQVVALSEGVAAPGFVSHDQYAGPPPPVSRWSPMQKEDFAELLPTRSLHKVALRRRPYDERRELLHNPLRLASGLKV